MPHFRSYYWAAQLRVLVSWMKLDMDTKWVHIEQSSVNTSLSALPFLTTNAWRKLRIQNEWVKYTLKVWKKIRQVLNLPLSTYI